MHASSSVILNAIKLLAGIPDTIHLLSPVTIEAIAQLKQSIVSTKNISLNLEETLISLSISAATNPTAQTAIDKLPLLRCCELHLSHIPTPGDEEGLRKLGLNVTSLHIMMKDA